MGEGPQAVGHALPLIGVGGPIWGRAGPREGLQEVGRLALPPIGLGRRSGAGAVPVGERGCGRLADLLYTRWGQFSGHSGCHSNQ